MNDNNVTISMHEYKRLISAECFANQFMNLLTIKAMKGESIFHSEVESICLMIGISAEEESDA